MWSQFNTAISVRMQKRTRKPKSDDLETRLANVSLDQEGGDPADAASIDDDVEEPETTAAVEEDPTQEKKAQKPKYVCRFHPGTVVSKVTRTNPFPREQN